MKPPFSRGRLLTTDPINMVPVVDADGKRVLTFAFDGPNDRVLENLMVSHIASFLNEVALVRIAAGEAA